MNGVGHCNGWIRPARARPTDKPRLIHTPPTQPPPPTAKHPSYSFPWSVENILPRFGIHFLAGPKHHDAHHEKYVLAEARGMRYDCLVG